MKTITIAVLVALTLNIFETVASAEDGGYCRNINPQAQVCR